LVLVWKIETMSPPTPAGRPGMSKIQLAVMDTGEANRRILNKDEYRADFRRVEAASLKRKTRLASAEGKRIFARCFYSFQASLYFVSALGRTKVPHEYVEQIEQAVRNKMDEGTKELNQAIDGAELLFKNHSIETVATYDTVPLEVEVGITSALGRRYFELIHKLDQLMPLLQTLEIEEVITEKQVEQQRSRFKRIVLALSSMMRNFAMGCRRRMNEADARRTRRRPSGPRPVLQGLQLPKTSRWSRDHRHQFRRSNLNNLRKGRRRPSKPQQKSRPDLIEQLGASPQVCGQRFGPCAGCAPLVAEAKPSRCEAPGIGPGGPASACSLLLL
jgi:hypothetical protein